MSMARKLAAIFYADVAGYSRLTGADEEGTHRRVMAMLDRATEQIGASSGTVRRYAGDAVLATFPSVVDAVNTAAAIQRERQAANQSVPAPERVEIRIGVNLGDVIEDRGEVFGDGVNLAARLEAAAEPGGICISGAAHEQIDGKVDLVFASGGERTFKNIARPIRVWHWTPEDAAAPPAASPEIKFAAGRETPAIAVLPFTNMSRDEEQEYFSDGLTEDIITALSHWRSIPVIARNSAFTYKGQAVSVRQIANELGVRYVLEGSVRKAGERIRVSAQLIDGETGHHVWAEKFDRQLADIFDIQDELTNRISATIVPELQSFEKLRSAKKATVDLDAWDFYLRGCEGFYLDTCEGIAAGRDAFQAAVESDPHYVDAWARLGWCHAKLVMQSCVDDPGGALAEGFKAARHAVELDESSALAHLALGTVHIWADETELGTDEALRAVELNPNYVEALFAAGNRLDLVGRTDEGVEMIRRALKLNPRDPARWRYMAYLSRACIARGDGEEALDWAHKAVSLRPENAEAQFRYAVALANVDRTGEAKRALERCEAAIPGYAAGKADWRPYPDAARNERVINGLRRHGLVGD